MASAQVKSCVLLAGIMADGRTVVHEPRPTRDHTERIMTMLDLPLQVSEQEISIEGSGGKQIHIEPREWQVPGDFSSAAFWLTAAAVNPKSCVTILNVGMNPRRIAFMNVLRRMGADIEILSECDSLHGEPHGDLRVKGRGLHGVTVGGDEIPNLIDECPLLAVAGAFAEGNTVIRDARELRVKECDRLAVMCENMRKLGFTVEEREDGMVVEGNRGAIHHDISVNSHGDHRVAMAMAVLASCVDAPVRIENVECVQTSYPRFWEHLCCIGGKIEME
jgi:3-phosphoshikimate 1-carboxyvinyltransferase